MRKSNLLGGAILLCVLTLFTGCKEIFGNLDLNGGAAVDPYLQLSKSSASIGVGQTYQIKATTISDATITYSSSDPSVATVDATGLVKGVGLGNTSIIVRVAESTNYKAGVAEFTVKVGLVTLEEESATIGYGKTYNIAAKTAATGATLTYESKNTAVATVDANGKVTAVACGDAEIVITSPATGTYPAETATFTANVRALDMDQVKAAIDDATDEVTVVMGPEISMTENYTLPDKKVTLVGDNTILTTNSTFIIKHNFTLKDLKIDITGTKQLVQFNPDGCDRKNQSVYSDATNQNINLLNKVSFENCLVKNLQNDIIDSNTSAWALENLTINDCIFQMNNEKAVIIRFDRISGSCIKDINIERNTFYNLWKIDGTGSEAYFIRFQHASNSLKVFGTSSTSDMNYIISNNTFINTSKNKNFGNNTPNSAVVKITMKNNIYYDVYLVDKFAQGNCTKTIENNFYYGIAASSSATTYMADQLDEAPFTAPTAALDLTKENGGLNLKPSGSAAAAGDPRWLK